MRSFDIIICPCSLLMEEESRQEQSNRDPAGQGRAIQPSVMVVASSFPSSIDVMSRSRQNGVCHLGRAGWQAGRASRKLRLKNTQHSAQPMPCHGTNPHLVRHVPSACSSREIGPLLPLYHLVLSVSHLFRLKLLLPTKNGLIPSPFPSSFNRHSSVY